MEKKIIIGIGIFAVIAAVFAGVLSFEWAKFELSINDETVSGDEYLYVMNQQINDVTQIMTNYGEIQVNSEFWTTEKDGKLPYEVLADHTVEQLKYNRAVYETAREMGYVDEVDYEHIVERMETENRIRAEKIKNNEPVYGLLEFSLVLFMEYEMDSFQKAYCNDLTNEGMEISEEERQQYYDKNKDAVFVKNDDLTLDYIEINYEAEGMGEEQAKELKNAMIDLFKSIDEEHMLSDLAVQSDLLGGYLQHEEILSGEFGTMSRVLGDVLEYAYELEIGETTQVIDESGCLYLIQCSDRVDYDYLPLDEVKDYINKSLRESHYDELIAKRAEQAVVGGDMDTVYDFTKKHINK